MKKSLYFALTAAALIGLSGCKSSGSNALSKLKTTCEAAIEKVDAFNKTLAQSLPTTEQSNQTTRSLSESEDITATYHSGTQYDYCEEQIFGLYIFNNICYCLDNFYNESNIKIGDVIKGTSRRIPSKELKVFYDDKALDLPDPILSVRCELSGDDENYIVSFQANWDFRNEHFKNNLPYVNTVISTNGTIEYSKEKGVKNISLNYYWTGINRIMATYNLNYQTNKFSCITFSNTENNLGWQYQENPNDTLIEYWNRGNLTAEKVKKLNYHYMYVYSGDITTDITKLNLSSKQRYVSKFEEGKKVVESEEGKSDFDNLFNTNYELNKAVKIKGDNDLLDLTNAKEVEIDKCVKYGECKSKIYWIYEGESNESKTYIKGVNPYQNRVELAITFDALKTKGATDKQIGLLNTASNYLKNSLKDGEYFGEFEDNVSNISFEYYFEGGETARYNVYDATYLQLQLKDTKDPSATVKFIVENGVPELNGHYGE